MRNIFLMLFYLISGSTIAQVVKQPDTSGYGLWEIVYNIDLSKNGEWMIYRIRTQSQPDTLVVKNTSGVQTYKIPEGQWGKISNNSQWFTVYLKGNTFELRHLKSGDVYNFKQVNSYGYTASENFIAISQNYNGNPILTVKDLINGAEYSFSGVVNFLMHPIEDKVAMVIRSEKSSIVVVRDLSKNTQKTLKSGEGFGFKNLRWSKDGSILTFMEEFSRGLYKEHKIYLCEMENCYKKLDFSLKPGLDSIYTIDVSYLEISVDQSSIYFNTVSKVDKVSNDIPEEIQIWNMEDKLIYPQKKRYNLFEKPKLRASWDIHSGKVFQIGDSLLPETIVLNDTYFLKYNRFANEPQYKYRGDVDIYICNIKTGDNKLLVPQISLANLHASPCGGYLVYFENENWWVYSIWEATFKNITGHLEDSFYNKGIDRDDLKLPYSAAVFWVKGEDALLLQDAFDVWKFTLDGKHQERLTKGREFHRIYRIYQDHLDTSLYPGNLVDLKRGLLLHAEEENSKFGYFYWRSINQMEKIVFQEAYVSGLKASLDWKYFTYKIQSYAIPPKIKFYSTNEAKTTIMVESNSNRKLNDWGRAELISYTMEDGTRSQYVCIFPAQYDPLKKYPMIVSIYDKQARELHEYFPISWYSEVGFNPSQYALDGYFILYPSINFEIGNPGISAYRHVKESIESITGKKNIDKNRIGLIGHSFGGYETAFILTQTDLFAAAVAGAAITDIVNFYHTINWNLGKEEMWRFESAGMRMGGSYYDLKEKYKQNSPFHHVENISTPLLLWAGGKDLHVHYNESIRFYLAMRRLNKKGKLLFFENEMHTILDLKNKRFLSHSIKEWFDVHLKGVIQE